MSEPQRNDARARDGKEETAGQGHEAPRYKPMRGRTAVILIVVGLVIAGVLAFAGVIPRRHANHKLAQTTDEDAAPSVNVDRPLHGVPTDMVVLPGALQAYIDSPIYARTSGYLGHWYYDIGAHVQKGALLATIESPEVDQELAQAKADLATAQANARNAAIQAQRYRDLLQQNAVSQQDTDNFVTAQVAGNTQVQAAQANVNRLEQMVGFERVYAPFTGVITARDIDNGQLINAGATENQQLFEEAQTRVLRVYVAVPQINSGGIRVGLPGQITLTQYPEQTFTGRVVRTADSIDPTTRTLLTEVDVDNPGGKLLPGSFGTVTFHLNIVSPSLMVPVPALIFQSQGTQVATVVDGKVKLVPVTTGQNDGKVIQILNGLTPQDEVIQNPPDALMNGEPVRVVQKKQAAGTAQEAS